MLLTSKIAILREVNDCAFINNKTKDIHTKISKKYSSVEKKDYRFNLLKFSSNFVKFDFFFNINRL
jgi:hypothetical protein